MAASWYFDFISPYAYLQLPRILALRERLAIGWSPVAGASGYAVEVRTGFAGFLAMVILMSQVRRAPEEGHRNTRWGRWGKPQIISSG